MREEEMEIAVSGLDKCYLDTESTSKAIPNKFSNVAKTGLFDLGISTINRQINGITTSIFNVKNIVKKHSGEMFNMDRKMAEIAEDIEIPQDFVSNDSRSENTFNQIILDKIDGKSVNTGQNTTKVEENFNSVVTKENLQNISNSQTLKEESYNDQTAINKQNLNNIDNNRTLEEQRLNDATNIAKEALNNINKAQDLNEVKINENSTIKSQILNNINNLKDMTTQELDSNTNINKTVLENINNDTKKATDSYINSFEDQIETMAQEIANKINQDKNETNG